MKLLFFAFFMFAFGFVTIQHVYGQENIGSINVSVISQENELVNPWGLEILVYQDSKENLYLDSVPTSNPFTLSNLPVGHTYFLQINRHDMLADIVPVTLDKPTKNIPITISGLGGIQIQAITKDGKYVDGGIVKIYSDKGNKWGESKINNKGLTERFWLQIPIFNSQSYTATITSPGGLVYDISGIKPGVGFMDLKVTTNWNSVIGDLIVVNLYKTETLKIEKSDGNFIVELYDNNSNKINESPVNNHGQAFFSKIAPGNHILRVLKLPQSATEKPLEWSTKQVFIVDNPLPINVFGYGSSGLLIPETQTTPAQTTPAQTTPAQTTPAQTTPAQTTPAQTTPAQTQKKLPETCNCVAFRLDNIQDNYLDTAQSEILNLFQKKQVPLTVGIIGENFGNDAKLVDLIKQLMKENLLEVGNNGKLVDITSLTKDQQFDLITNSNKQIWNTLGVTPSVFIPIYGNFNADTVEVLNANNMLYISGVSSADPPPYAFHDVSVYRYPATAATGYIQPGNAWFGKTHDTVLTDIEFSLNNNGFAVIVLNPHEYSIRKNWTFQNQVDLQQILELNQVINTLQQKGVKILPITEINTHLETSDKKIHLLEN